MRRHLSAALLAASAIALLSGCGVHDPYNDEPKGRTTSTATTATTQHPGMAPVGPNDPKPPAPQVDPDRLPATPQAAIERYVALAGTWDWRTVRANHRALEPLTCCAARTAARQVVAQIPLDPRYRTQRVRQRTTLEATVAKGATAGGRQRYLVVQRRRIELKATPSSNAWVVTLVTLRPFAGRWAVERWEDQG